MPRVRIGHASIDERGKAAGGQAGDQTGKEVCIRDWYDGGWNVLLRPRSSEAAEKIAATCETLCEGGFVGYDQYQRNTLWDELEKVGWDAAKMKTPCETDCSAFVTACARAAGIDIPRVNMGGGRWNAPVTSTMRMVFMSTGAFDCYMDQLHLRGKGKLRRGDILVRTSGHTAMVLDNGDSIDILPKEDPAKTDGGSGGGGSIDILAGTDPVKPAGGSVTASEAAKGFYRNLSGVYVCTASSLNIRDGAGITKKILTTIKRGDVVRCYGYFTSVVGTKWLYVQFRQTGVLYTGFASSSYLRLE